jgi:hypothetical protein
MMCGTDDDKSHVFLTRHHNIDADVSVASSGLSFVFFPLYRLTVPFLYVLAVTRISLDQLTIQKRIRVAPIE